MCVCFFLFFLFFGGGSNAVVVICKRKRSGGEGGGIMQKKICQEGWVRMGLLDVQELYPQIVGLVENEEQIQNLFFPE